MMVVFWTDTYSKKRFHGLESTFFIMNSLWEEVAGVTKRSSTSTVKTDYPER